MARLTVVALLLGLLAIPAAAPAAVRAKRCLPRGAELLTRGFEVDVYRRGRSVAACSRKTGARVRLGRRADENGLSDERPTVGPAEVAGRFVAFEEGVIARSAGIATSQRMVLVDVRARRRVDIGATGCATQDRGPAVVSFALTSVGQLVWSCVAQDFHDLVTEIRKFDGAGAGVLDAARVPQDGVVRPDDLDPGSLALSTGETPPTAYWLRGETPRSAPLR